MSAKVDAGRVGHTPGPWFVDDGCHDDVENMRHQLLRGKETENEWIAVGLNDSDGYSESVAYCHPMNAPLIAAAPELLEALRAIVKGPGLCGPEAWREECLRNAVANGRAAIARATGQAV